MSDWSSDVGSSDLPMVQSGVCRVSTETGRFIWNPRTVTTLGGIGVVSGLFTGMLGVGGGFIIVPALGNFSELRMHSIVATYLLGIAKMEGRRAGYEVCSTCRCRRSPCQ